MGAYTTMADLARGRHEQVVRDFYWYLLHSTAAHAFPEGIYYKKCDSLYRGKSTLWIDNKLHLTKHPMTRLFPGQQ
jgi:hypothetical protein